MKYICSLSGLEFEAPLFHSIHLQAGRTYHQFFDTSQDSINSLYTSYLNNAYNPTESYMLFILLLKHTSLVQWNCPIRIPNEAERNWLVANHMQSLFRISNIMSSLEHPNFIAPSVLISAENCDLDTVKYWIDLWNEAYKDFLDGLERSNYLDSLRAKEKALEKFIKSPQIAPEKYAKFLATWASQAAYFPAHTADYWQEIIIRSHNLDKLVGIPLVDLEELLEHCEEYIDEYTHGSISSHALFMCLQESIKLKKEIFSAPIGTSFAIADTESAEHKLALDIISKAPSVAPERKDYPNEFAYRKALMSYKLSNRFITAQAVQPTTVTPLNTIESI